MFRILNSFNWADYYMSVQILGNLLSLISKTPDFEFIELGRPLYVCPSPWEFIVVEQKCSRIWTHSIGKTIMCLSKSFGSRWSVKFRIFKSLNWADYCISVQILWNSLSLISKVPDFEFIDLDRLLYVCPNPWKIVVFCSVKFRILNSSILDRL